jgi:hypothetical protein
LIASHASGTRRREDALVSVAHRRLADQGEGVALSSRELEGQLAQLMLAIGWREH